MTRTDASLWRAMLPYLSKHGRTWAMAMALVPATALATIAQPWLLQRTIDQNITTGDVAGIAQAAWLYLLAVVVGFGCQVAHTALLSAATIRSITDLRRGAFRHLLSLRASFFDREPTGRLLTRVTSDVEALNETLNAGAFTIVLDAVQVVGVIAAMFWLDWRLTLVLLLVGPPLVLAIELIRRRLRALFNEVHTTLATLNAWTAERLEGLETVQLLADERRALSAFEQRLGRYRDATVRSNLYDALLFALVDGVSAVTMALLLFYSSGGWLGTVTTAGTIAAFIDYLGKLFTPIQEFSQKVAVLQRAGAALEKIFSLLDVDEHIAEGPLDPGPVHGHVAIRGLTFAYEPGRPVLSDINLDLRPGEVVALCGRTGSGKTTIGSLLTRSYDGYQGTIELDGRDIRSLRTRSVRRAIAAVRQDAQLLPGTVRDNLTLGRPMPDERLWEVLRLMQADDVVHRLGGLDAVLDAGGRNVSGGEAQLLSLARTMLYDPAVVVLDEATASVDTMTEVRIQKAIDTLLASRTTLVIAHRLSTVLGATRIVLLDEGRVLEVGDHAQLVALNGRYAELFRQQFAEHGSGSGAALLVPTHALQE